LGVVLDGAWCSCFDVFNFRTNVRNYFFQGNDAFLA
jgi:hypothetical protein